MKISFAPPLPPSEDWSVIEKNVRNELEHFEDRYQNFPSELVVKVETDRALLSVSGVAVSIDGKPIIAIEYSLLSPHLAKYQYVGGSPEIEH